MTLTLTEKILIVLTIIFAVGIAYFYFENKSLQTHLTQKTDSLYVSTQNVAALNDKIKMVNDSLLIYAVFVKNLQNNETIADKKYILLQSEYQRAKQEWAQNGGGHLNVIVDSTKKDTNTIEITFKGIKGKISYDGYTRYYPNTKDYNWYVHFIQFPSIYKSRLYLDESTSENRVMNLLTVDGELIGNAETTMDEKLFLLLKNNKINDVLVPNFWDRLTIGASISSDGDNIIDVKLLSNYNIDVSAKINYSWDHYQLSVYKSVISSGYGISLDAWMSTREWAKTIFGIK